MATTSSTIGDMVVIGSVTDLKQHLSELSASALLLSKEISDTVVRSNESVVYCNFMKRTAQELMQLREFVPGGIAGVAWVSRNLFEIDLLIAHLVRSEDNLGRWLGQLALDEKQVIEGMLALCSSTTLSEATTLEQRLRTIDKLALKHEVQLSSHFNMKDLSRKANVEREYEAIYKLASKFVHPSSWSINAMHASAYTGDYERILLTYAQIFAESGLSRTRCWLNDHVAKRNSTSTESGRAKGVADERKAEN